MFANRQELSSGEGRNKGAGGGVAEVGESLLRGVKRGESRALEEGLGL